MRSIFNRVLMQTVNDKEVKLDLRIRVYPHTWYTDMFNPVMTTTTIGSRRITQINSIRRHIINICPRMRFYKYGRDPFETTNKFDYRYKRILSRSFIEIFIWTKANVFISRPSFWTDIYDKI